MPAGQRSRFCPGGGPRGSAAAAPPTTGCARRRPARPGRPCPAPDQRYRTTVLPQVDKYTYEVCPFSKAAQKEGHSSTSLGSWQGLAEDDRKMLFQNGASCWQGPSRSMTVRAGRWCLVAWCGCAGGPGWGHTAGVASHDMPHVHVLLGLVSALRRVHVSGPLSAGAVQPGCCCCAHRASGLPQTRTPPPTHTFTYKTALLLQVSLRCGQAEKLAKVEEPSRCEYTAELETPAACTQQGLDALRAELAARERLLVGGDEEAEIAAAMGAAKDEL